ncbi:MAG: hypothetical protein IKF52_03235 [Clostridia bacterium]|nr:hypothetical protein [Clostridia bacterium]
MSRYSEGKNDIYSEMKRSYKIDKKILDGIINDYRNKMSAFMISKKYKLNSSNEVYSIIQKYEKSTGIKVREKEKEEAKKKVFDPDIESAKLKHKYNLDFESMKDIVDLYDNGVSGSEISSKYHIKNANIYQIIDKSRKILKYQESEKENNLNIVSEEELKKIICIYKLNKKHNINTSVIADSFDLEEEKVISHICFMERIKVTVNGFKNNGISDSQMIDVFKNKGIMINDKIIHDLQNKNERNKEER